MEDKNSTVVYFFNQLWSFASDKHSQGAYNTVCLAVLVALPLLVLLTCLVVCCHCCCGGRHANSCGGCCCCCCRRDSAAMTARSETKKTKKKKKNGGDKEDLWISVKAGQMTPDRIAMVMV